MVVSKDCEKPYCQTSGQNLVKPAAAHVLLNQSAGDAQTVRESSSVSERFTERFGDAKRFAARVSQNEKG